MRTRVVVVSGDTRNDLYLSVERGEFERGGKSVQKNIEVTLYVLYADGDTLKVPPTPHYYRDLSEQGRLMD